MLVAVLLIVLLLVAIFAGGVAAVAGFGIGSLLTPLLAIEFGTRTAVLLVAIPHATATALRLWLLRANVDRRVLLTFGAASAVGGLVGALLLSVFASRTMGIILGVLLIFSGLGGLTGLTSRMRIPAGPWAVAAGMASGAFGGLVGNQGGIRAAALLHFGLSPAATVATATGIALAVDAARIPIYLATDGAVIAENWPYVVVGAIGVVVGTLLATPILRRLPQDTFRRFVFIVVAALGVLLILAPGS
ncbi:MAG: sulfite exporter TauE/SafE family protein [Chloroflexi bacterium]|nr:MAG: sulfite exporter TauE/SafE family protein [Chloroflexota bacterium]